MATLFGFIAPSQSALDFPVALTERYRPHSIDSFIGLAKPKAICLLRPQIQPYPIRRKAQRVRLGVVGQVQRLALAPILIDGCAVPRILYDRIKAQALATGKTQCVGVICNVPARPQSERFSLMDIFEPPALFAALRSGEHSVFVIDQTCEELHARRDLAMILYFSPFGE